jgi:hypothetical protein
MMTIPVIAFERARDKSQRRQEQGMTRKWRRKPLKLLKMDSAM